MACYILTPRISTTIIPAIVELNYATGCGLDIIQETLTFKNLPGHPTLNGLAEEKVTGLFLLPTLDISHYEVLGQLPSDRH